MYVRNMDGLLNKEELIKHIVEVNIYYQGHQERTEINVIRGQKWMVILEMPWLAHHNSEIDWKTEEDRGSENDEMPRKVWKVIETRIEEVWLAEAKRERGKRRKREKTGRAGNEEEKGKENSRGKKNSREIIETKRVFTKMDLQ